VRHNGKVRLHVLPELRNGSSKGVSCVPQGCGIGLAKLRVLRKKVGCCANRAG